MATWRKIFLELATRAVIQVHHRYSVWQLGQKELTVDDFEKLNQGDGIFFAYEEHVRDAIAQQIIETGLFKTHPIKGANGETEHRSYVIDREYKIEIPYEIFVNYDDEKEFLDDIIYTKSKAELTVLGKKKEFNVDIVFKRLEDINKSDNSPTRPSLIEAKRFELVNIDFLQNIVTIGNPQIDAIDKDILKLMINSRYARDVGIEFNGKVHKIWPFPHLLIWGRGNEAFNINTALIDQLKRR